MNRAKDLNHCEKDSGRIINLCNDEYSETVNYLGRLESEGL